MPFLNSAQKYYMDQLQLWPEAWKSGGFGFPRWEVSMPAEHERSDRRRYVGPLWEPAVKASGETWSGSKACFLHKCLSVGFDGNAQAHTLCVGES